MPRPTMTTDKASACTGKRWLQTGIYCALAVYLALCVMRLAALRPLWLDEEFILKNLKELSGLKLFGPLRYAQGFPRLYLFFIGQLAGLFGYQLLALRILPFSLMLSGFFLWLKAYRQEEGEGSGFLLFALSWCGSAFMSGYAAELKQYSADVVAAALLALFILRQKGHLASARPGFSILAGYFIINALLLFSYAAYFFMPLIAYNLLVGLKARERQAGYCSACFFLSFIIFACASWRLDVSHTLADQHLRGYWQDYLISTASLYEFFKSFSEGLRNLFVRWFLEREAITHIMTILFPFALVSLFREAVASLRRFKGHAYSIDTITAYLLIALFLAGLFKVYPFTGARVTLFVAPFIFHAIIKSTRMFRGILKPANLVLSSTYVLTLLSVTTYLIINYALELSR